LRHSLYAGIFIQICTEENPHNTIPNGILTYSYVFNQRGQFADPFGLNPKRKRFISDLSSQSTKNEERRYKFGGRHINIWTSLAFNCE
jgi:hypothetical protein